MERFQGWFGACLGSFWIMAWFLAPPEAVSIRVSDLHDDPHGLPWRPVGWEAPKLGSCEGWRLPVESCIWLYERRQYISKSCSLINPGPIGSLMV